MASQIAFTDDVGAATLASPIPSPGDRFGEWTPDVIDVASVEVPLGDGVTQQFLHRRDYVVGFVIRNLTSAEHGVALRLKEWLLGGGEVAVTVGDTTGHEYDCVLQPGTVPTLAFVDARMIEFELRLQLKHVTDLPLIADYAA